MMPGADLHTPGTPGVLQVVHLDWQHACKGQGCSDKLCELCMHSPSRRCSSNTKPKYASGDHIKSTCDEAPDVVLLDNSGNRVYPARGSRLQIMMLDDRKLYELLDQQGIKHDDKQPDGPLLSSLFRDERELLNTCVVDRPLLKWRSGAATPLVVLPFEGGSLSLSSLQCVKPYKADPTTKQSGQTTKYHLWIQATDDQGSPLSTVSNHIISDVFTLVTTRAKGAAKSIIPQPWEGVAMLDGLGRDAVEALRTLGQKVDAAVGLPVQLGSVTKVKHFWQLVSWVNQAGVDSQTRQQQLLKDTKIKQADFRNAAEHVQRAAFPDYRPRVWWRPGTNQTAGLLFACNNSEIQLSLGPIASVLKRPGKPDELAALQAVQLQNLAVQQAVQLAAEAWQQPGHGGSWAVYWSDAAAEPWMEEADPWAEKALGPSLGTFSMLNPPAGVVAAAGAEQGSGAVAVAAVQPDVLPELFYPPSEQQQEQVADEVQQQPQHGEGTVVQQQQQQSMLQGVPWSETPGAAAASYAYGNMNSTTNIGLRHPAQQQQQQPVSTMAHQLPSNPAFVDIPATMSLPAAALGDVGPLHLPASSFVTSPLTAGPWPLSPAVNFSTLAAAGAVLQLPDATAGPVSRDIAAQQPVRYSRAVTTEAPRAAAPNTAVQITPAAAAVQAVHTVPGQAVHVAAIQAPSAAAAAQITLSAAAAVGPPPGTAAAAVPGSFMAMLASEGLAAAATAATGVASDQMPMQQEFQNLKTAPGAAAGVDAWRQETAIPAAAAAAAAAAVVEQGLLQPVPPKQTSGAGALNAANSGGGSSAAGASHFAAAAGAGDLDAAAICAALRQAINHDDNGEAAAAVAFDASLGGFSGISGSSYKLEELLQFRGEPQSADLHLDSLLAGGSLFSDGIDQREQLPLPPQLQQQQQQQHEFPVQSEAVPAEIQEAAAAADHSNTSKPSHPGSNQARSLTRAYNSLNERGSKPMQLRQPLTAQHQRQQQQQQSGTGQGGEQQQQQQQLEKKRDRQQRKAPAVQLAAAAGGGGTAAAMSAADKAFGSEEQQQQQLLQQLLQQHQQQQLLQQQQQLLQQAGAAVARPACTVTAAVAVMTGGAELADTQEQPATAAAAAGASRTNGISDSSLGLEGLIGFEQIINQGLLETMASTGKARQGQQAQANEQQQQQGWRGMGFNWSTPPGVSGPEDFTAAFPASLMGQTASYLSPVDNIAAPSVAMLAPHEGEDVMGLSGLMSTLELEHAPPTRKARA